MQPISIIGVFCEDMREEKSGTDTLISILPDTIKVVEIPATIPKLGLYVRVHIDINHAPPPIPIRLNTANEEIAITILDEELIKKARSNSTANGAPSYDLISRAMFSLFPVREEVRMNAIATISGQDVIFASLRIQKE